MLGLEFEQYLTSIITGILAANVMSNIGNWKDENAYISLTKRKEVQTL